jgi:hypothetical protein
MIEFILNNGAQFGYNRGWITADVFFSLVFGGWGYHLYSEAKKSSDAGHKVLGVMMMVFGVINILVSVAN